MSDFVANKSREPGELLTLSGGQSTSEGLFGKTLAHIYDCQHLEQAVARLSGSFGSSL